MNFTKFSLAMVGLGSLLGLVSCIQDEPLNAECDIEQVVLHLDNPEQVFFQASDTMHNVLYSDSVINFTVRSRADLTALAPVFRLTAGATVTPPSGSVQDFSHGPVLYTVTSQDGNWHRRYWLGFTPMTVTVNDTLRIDFEEFDLEPANHRFYVWRNSMGVPSLGETWASGNSGFKLSKPSAQPDDYPTAPMLDGYDGCGLRLVTRDTGVWGAMAQKPIASGNLFIGEFDVTKAMSSPLQSTLFGKPFDRKPYKMTGFYKYKAGAEFQVVQDGKITVIDRQDEGSIYAVLYRNHDAQGNPVMLMGDDVLTNPNIVGIAQVARVGDTSQWTPFEAEFVFTREVDRQLLDEMGYNLTIVFASSKEGAHFEGAIGSELCVDKVRLICTRQE